MHKEIYKIDNNNYINGKFINNKLLDKIIISKSSQITSRINNPSGIDPVFIDVDVNVKIISNNDDIIEYACNWINDNFHVGKEFSENRSTQKIYDKAVFTINIYLSKFYIEISGKLLYYIFEIDPQIRTLCALYIYRSEKNFCLINTQQTSWDILYEEIELRSNTFNEKNQKDRDRCNYLKFGRLKK